MSTKQKPTGQQPPSPHSAAAKMQTRQREYQQLQKNNQPPQHLLKNCINAFWTGGLICLIAQGVQQLLLSYADFNEKTVGAPTSAIIILLAIILTACGVYDRISQFAGAGSAVPITGFANTMSSAAMEYRSEGFVLGVGGNMFKVAGPVIVFGAVSGIIVAIIKVLFLELGGAGL